MTIPGSLAQQILPCSLQPSPLGQAGAVGVGWDPSQPHFLPSCPSRRNTEAERRKLGL